MTLNIRLLLIPLLILFHTGGVFAEPRHGLSLYGPQGLKYKADEPYEYANPKATKGGHLVLSDFGAFTKLNPSSHLKQSSAGRIVNIASTEALGGQRFLSAYTAAKHGVLGLTRALAVELGETGVTVKVGT